VAASIATVAWLSVAGLLFLAVAPRDEPEGLTGLAVAVVMQLALLVALGSTSVAALLYYKIRGGQLWLLIAVVASLATALVGGAWWEIV
jgi:hypothetical protein